MRERGIERDRERERVDLLQEPPEMGILDVISFPVYNLLLFQLCFMVQLSYVYILFIKIIVFCYGKTVFAKYD